MKILHIADIHYRNDLLEEINKCTGHVLETIRRILPDVVIIAGDVFDERQAHDSPAFLSAAGFVHALSECAPVLIVNGTTSHDGHTLKFLESERVYVSEVLEQAVLTEKGFANFDGILPKGTKALFSCLPSISKAQVVTAIGGALSESTMNTVDILRDVLRSWGDIFYSGSITRLNFSEEEEKGFRVHTLEKGSLSSEFIKTPARTMVTANFEGLPSLETAPEIPEGAFVRIKYEVPEDEVHCVDENALKERLVSCEATDVRIEKTVVPKQRVRAEGISSLVSLEEKLRKWAENTGTEVPSGVLEKLPLLERAEKTFGKSLQLEADVV